MSAFGKSRHSGCVSFVSESSEGLITAFWRGGLWQPKVEPTGWYPPKGDIQVYGTIRFLVTDTLIKTNRNDTATIRVISFKKGYFRNNGASPNPKNAPTNAPTKPTTILVTLNILSNLRRPGSIPTNIPVTSMSKINIVPLPCHFYICFVLPLLFLEKNFRNSSFKIAAMSQIGSMLYS